MVKARMDTFWHFFIDCHWYNRKWYHKLLLLPIVIVFTPLIIPISYYCSIVETE